jgi:hypothetical protein
LDRGPKPGWKSPNQNTARRSTPLATPLDRNRILNPAGDNRRMIPMKTSTIFKSRWMALIWAAGVIWFAYDVAGGSAQSTGNTSANADQATDVTGAPITTDDEKKFEQALNGL